MKESKSAVLLPSCLNGNWWADSMECYTYLRNVTDLLSDGKTPCERRFGQPFNGPIIPFCSLVEDCSSEMHCTREEFGRVTYWSQTFRSWRWWTHRNLLEKTQCERGDISQTRRIYFPNRRWANQNTRRRSGIENIHLIRDRPIRGESVVDFLGESESVSSTLSRLIAGCRWSENWFLVLVKKLHWPPSRWSQSQTLLARRRIIPYSTEIHHRIQNCSNEFGCQARATHRRHWNYVSRDLWTGFTECTLGRKPPEEYMWSGRRLTSKQPPSKPDN